MQAGGAWIKFLCDAFASFCHCVLLSAKHEHTRVDCAGQAPAAAVGADVAQCALGYPRPTERHAQAIASFNNSLRFLLQMTLLVEHYVPHCRCH